MSLPGSLTSPRMFLSETDNDNSYLNFLHFHVLPVPPPTPMTMGPLTSTTPGTVQSLTPVSSTYLPPTCRLSDCSKPPPTPSFLPSKVPRKFRPSSLLHGRDLPHSFTEESLLVGPPRPVPPLPPSFKIKLVLLGLSR